MKACCLESFANKGIRQGFRIAVEHEAHTCEKCHALWRLVDGKWRETDEGTHKTVNFIKPEDDDLDLGWAMGRRDRERGIIIVQCWGCGGVTEIPDQPFVEMHFDHTIGNCSVELAARNRQRGVMPSYHH